LTDVGNEKDQQTPPRKSLEAIPADKNLQRRKSNEREFIDLEKDSMSMDSEKNDPRRKSVELAPMDLDKADDSRDPYYGCFDDDDHRESVVTNVVIPRGQNSKNIPNMPKAYLTREEFENTIAMLDKKIGALYKLNRHISDQQQENTRSLNRLVALDELSGEFWNVSYSG
jgi:hypothetical protein